MTACRARTVGLTLVGIGLFWLARSIQEGGHGWGDDFAMYINQARGLADGTADLVVADNRYALANSAYRFGPIAYPWGFPAMLAPVVAAAGIDYGALKLVGTASFVIGVLCLYLLVEPRLRGIEAAVLGLFIGLNAWYLGATDSVLSDLPFWAAGMATLLVLDRTVLHDRLLDREAMRRLVLIGLMIAFAFNVRREGAALLIGLAAAQAVRLAAEPRDRWRAHLRPIAAPYVAFVVGVATAQFVRPATVLSPSEDFGPTGPRNIRFNAEWYRNPLAELIGLKDVGPNDITLFGSHALGIAAFAGLLVSAVAGIVAALVHDRRRDAHLAATFIALTLAILVQPFREGRYLYSLLPFLLYFAFRGLRTVAAVVVPDRFRVAVVVAPTAAMLVLFTGVLSDTRSSIDYHHTYEYTSWGPESPDSLELFDAIERFTDNRDVVVFYQARTMNLYTHRRAIQGNNVQMMVERGDWYAMTRDSDYIQTLLTDADAADLGFVKVWENASFVLWDIPPREPPEPCCP